MTRPAPACVALAALAAVALAASAAAQTGPFQPMSSWYVHPFTGSIGVLANTNDFTFDTDGNGLHNPPADHTHDRPAPLETGTWTFRLTPSRQILYAFGTPNPFDCPGGTTVYFYRIPAADGAPLQLIRGPLCIANDIAHDGFFDQPGTWGQRIACIVEGSDPTDLDRQRVHWIDLVTGAYAASFPTFDRIVSSPVYVSPSGVAAYLQYDTSDGDNLADYAAICLTTDHLGEVLNPTGGFLAQLAPPFADAVMIDDAGTLTIHALWPDPGTVRASFPLSGCITSPPPPPPGGACCLAGGGCQEGVTATECSQLGGSWSGSGSMCATAGCPPPPAPDLHVTLTGPASVPRPEPITWTITWQNSGALAAAGVTVVDSLPLNVTFVSATRGGVYDPFSRRVTWSVGTLNPGALGGAQVTARTLCTGAATVTNETYRITGTPGGTVIGTPPVVTALQSPSTAPVTVGTTSVAVDPLPLGDGGQMEHTITLQEGSGVARDTVRISFAPGPETTLGAVIDSAGGTIRPNAFGTQYTWSGPLGANASVAIRFRTVVSSCRTGQYATTALHNGSFLIAVNTCGGFLGLAQVTTSFPLTGPSLATELVPNVGTQPAPWQRVRVAAVRPGDTFQIELRAINNTSGALPSAQVSVTLPFELGSGDPPFVGTPPAGTAWDPFSRAVTWSGSLGPSAVVAIPIEVTLDGASSGARVDAQARVGACPTGPGATLFALGVQPPPAGDHVLQLGSGGRLVATTTGGSPVSTTVMDPPFGFVTYVGGLGRASDGDLWFAGTPTFMLNPVTLDFRTVDDPLLLLQLDAIGDVAWDPADSSLVFCGYRLTNRLGVRRWKPSTGVMTPLYTATPGAGWTGAKHIAVGADGSVACETSVGIVRIPPSGPAVVWDEPSILDEPQGLAVEASGDYLSLEGLFSTSVRRLARIDDSTGAFTTIADLETVLPPGNRYVALDAGPDGDVFVSGYDDELLVLHTQPSFSFEPLAPTGNGTVVDMLYVEAGGTTDAPPQVRAPVELAFAAPAPNPASRATVLRFGLPRAAHVALTVYDVGGREVAEVARGWREAGEHAVAWEGVDRAGRRVASGLYLIRFEAEGRSFTRKVVLAW
jgi:uncharacterized repeat protein (TIGR01451 family)